MSRLLISIRNEIRRRNYSYKTEQSYIMWAKRFIKFCNMNHPLEVDQKQIVHFLNYLANECHVASSTQNQALCALGFLYREVLNHPVGVLDGLKMAKRYHHIPVVLSEGEVKQILNEMDGVKSLIVQLLYGSGLRISECLRMRIQDLDFDYRQIEVRNSKGARDRITMMPEKLITHLKNQISKVQFLHQRDLAKGLGEVLLPKALAKNIPVLQKNCAGNTFSHLAKLEEIL